LVNQVIPVEEISVTELSAQLASDSPPRLIDVRTPEERATACIKDSQLADDAFVKSMLETWDKSTNIVVHCHHGGRSLQAANFLTQQGFTHVKNLTGGIDAWSLEVDTQIPRY